MTNPNESAFPEVREQPQYNKHSYGLTKREYFASLAMQGLLSNSDYTRLSQKVTAIYAVEMADALIKELNEERITLRTTNPRQNETIH